MPAQSPVRVAVIVAAVGIAVACMTLPVIADTPVTVTFQANNPWTQEIGSVNREDFSHDYSVVVAAAKTLQVNLVTRDPNVFFKVKDETQRKQLVDTYQTGATTWSILNPTTATYTIHVYVDPNAMQRGEDAKYALQIGQYGAADMQAATTELTFQGNNPWVQVSGTLDHLGSAHDYTVAIAAGKTLATNLITRNPGVHFKVKNHISNQILVDTSQTGATKWSTPVATATTFTIDVYADSAAVPPGATVGYALQIGHYDTVTATTAAPAPSTTSAATPAAPASQMPAPATTAHP
ncbi:MAG: hypothetical protein ACREPU_08050 [Rhodanobacteraceae bacterium]